MLSTFEFRKNHAAAEWFSNAVFRIAGCHATELNRFSPLGSGNVIWGVIVDTSFYGRFDTDEKLTKILRILYKTAIRVYPL